MQTMNIGRLADLERLQFILRAKDLGFTLVEKRLIDACPGKGELKGCPIVAALSGSKPVAGASE